MRRSGTKDMSLELDQKLFAAMNLMFYQDVPKSQHPDVFAIEVFGKYGNDNWQKTFEDYADYVYSNTALLDSTRFNSLCNADQIEQLMKDPAVVHALSVMKN
jgi:hypothetical protein